MWKTAKTKLIEHLQSDNDRLRSENRQLLNRVLEVAHITPLEQEKRESVPEIKRRPTWRGIAVEQSRASRVRMRDLFRKVAG